MGSLNIGTLLTESQLAAATVKIEYFRKK